MYIGHQILYLYGWFVGKYVIIADLLLCGYPEIGNSKGAGGGGCMNFLSFDWE